MALGDRTFGALVFFLVFSAVFPVFGYALTLPIEGTLDTGNISVEALMQAGILMTDAATVNVTRDGEWYDFDLNASDYRVKWVSDNFTFQVPNQILGWWLPTTIEPDPYKGVWAIGNYSSTYEWTHFVLDPDGGSKAECFFTIYPEYESMIESMANGNVTITIGKSFEQGATDIWAFAGWYLGMITGIQTYGMPAFFVWIIRIFTIIGILCSILLAKEFIPTLG